MLTSLSLPSFPLPSNHQHSTENLTYSSPHPSPPAPPSHSPEAMPSSSASPLQKLQPHLSTLSASYLHHRPLIQKILTISFVLYAFGSTAKGLVAPGKKLKDGDVVEKRSKGRKSKGGKGPRVEVSFRAMSSSSILPSFRGEGKAKELTLIYVGSFTSGLVWFVRSTLCSTLA